MCWPKDNFKGKKAPHAFLCTDVELDTLTILEYYSKRWPGVFRQGCRDPVGERPTEVKGQSCQRGI
ncbi:MAG TPA: hypothetical protein DHV24_06070 [Candidatus Margulisbacteria bacterium]|nr:hypothetical protein [Candidatus Margulisiibacteriota bacterium]